MWKKFIIFSSLLLLGMAALPAQDQTQSTTSPGEYKIPPEASKQVNPMKATPESLARGKKMYGYDCAMCHGKTGDGKTDLATEMDVKLADLRDPAALKNVSDGDLFYIIKTGKGQMTAEGDRVKADDIWDVINYTRSLAKKETPTKEKAE